MRPNRSIIFLRINSINRVKRMIKEDKSMRRWEIISTISGAMLVALMFTVVYIIVLTIFSVL